MSELSAMGQGLKGRGLSPPQLIGCDHSAKTVRGRHESHLRRMIVVVGLRRV
jgi:hypothetical protein